MIVLPGVVNGQRQSYIEPERQIRSKRRQRLHGMRCSDDAIGTLGICVNLSAAVLEENVVYPVGIEIEENWGKSGFYIDR